MQTRGRSKIDTNTATDDQIRKRLDEKWTDFVRYLGKKG